MVNESSVSDVRRAFAVLELEPGASRGAVRRQYRRLVKRWHPDRFTGDPAGVAQATQKIQQIAAAYAVVEATQTVRGRDVSVAERGDQYSSSFGRRLTSQEINDLSEAIGRSSWVELAGKGAVVVCLVYGGLTILRFTRPLVPWREVTGYDSWLGGGLVLLGLVAGWRLLRVRTHRAG